MIIGLGNPGRQYDETRHNAGFMMVDRIAQSLGVAFSSMPKWQAHLCRTQTGILLVKPQTFMNVSGQSVGKIMRFHQWQPKDILVIYDDVALPLGTIRFREKGSAGGHNGIKSLIEHLGTQEFSRLKLGVGGPKTGEMVGHVLGKFAPSERDELENMLATGLEAVQVALSQGMAIAANRFHKKSNPPRESTPNTRSESAIIIHHPPPHSQYHEP